LEKTEDRKNLIEEEKGIESQLAKLTGEQKELEEEIDNITLRLENKDMGSAEVLSELLEISKKASDVSQGIIKALGSADSLEKNASDTLAKAIKFLELFKEKKARYEDSMSKREILTSLIEKTFEKLEGAQKVLAQLEEDLKANPIKKNTEKQKIQDDLRKLTRKNKQENNDLLAEVKKIKMQTGKIGGDLPNISSMIVKNAQIIKIQEALNEIEKKLAVMVSGTDDHLKDLDDLDSLIKDLVKALLGEQIFSAEKKSRK